MQFSFLSRGILLWIDQKIQWTLARDIRKHWTAVSTLLGFISSVYPDLLHWGSNQRPHNAEQKLYYWITNPHRTQVMLYQLVMVIAKPSYIRTLYRGSTFCSRWFDLQWGRSRHTLLMRPNKVETAVQCFRSSAGFSGHGNSIHNIIPLRKEKCTLSPCPWGLNNYGDAYFPSSWEDVALEVTVSPVKSTDVTYKTHSS